MPLNYQRVKKIVFYIIAGFLILSLNNWGLPLITKASLIDELNKQIQEAAKQQKQLEEQVQKYKNLAQEKRQEIANLNNQLDLMQAEIDQLDNQIKITENKIDQVNLEILKTQYEIEQKELEIQKEKENLAEILRTVYRTEQTDLVEIVLQNNSFSEFFDQLVYLDNLQKGVQQTINNLTNLKIQLNAYRLEQQQQRLNLEGHKINLQQDKEITEDQKGAREDLLLVTRGQEKEYQRLLGQIEAQRRTLLGDIDRLRHERGQELARLEAQQERPQEGLASESWYFNQTDERWAQTKIGLSRSLLKDYGCAVTSVAMVLKYYGIDIDPGRLAKQKIFWYNLIVWPDEWQNVKLIENTKHQGIDWLRIDQELTGGHPVIVYIKAIGTGSGHYVVIHHKTSNGRYVVHDPYWGPNLYLDSSEALLAKLYNTSIQVDQMVIYH